MEVVCSTCGGRLMAETPGIVVECPHCQAHLQIPAENSEAEVAVSEGQSALSAPVATAGAIEPPPESHDHESGTVGEDAVQFNPFVPAAAEEQIDADAQPFPVMSDVGQPVPETPAIETVEAFPDVLAAAAVVETPSQEEVSAVESHQPPKDGAADVVSAADLSDSFHGGAIANSIHREDQPTPPQQQVDDSAEAVFPGLPGASGVVPATTDAPQFDGIGDSPTVIDNLNFGEPPPSEEVSITEAFTLEPIQTTDSPITPTEPAAVNSVSAEVSADAVGDFRPNEESPATEATELTSRAASSESSPRRGVPRFWFLIAVSYASAVTIALVVLWVWYQRSKQLNLPDVVPKQTGDGKVTFTLYPEGRRMPKWHQLNLGDTKQFGHLEITAVKVTRGPVIISTESGEELPTEAVLKLWLRIKNISDDQTFAPIGRTLARKRASQSHRANIFVCRADQKHADGDRVLMYDLAVDDPRLVLKGQNIDHPLKPGENYETFLATDEAGIARLTGDLVWRVRVRKGYNPVSKWGVTTVFEVNFDSGEVADE